MPAPTQSSSLYKRRVISAMLDGQQGQASPPPRRPPHIWSREIVYMVFALAFVSAAGVFFLLYHRDNSALSRAGFVATSVGQSHVTPVAPHSDQPAVATDLQKASPVAAEPPKVIDARKGRSTESESLPVKIKVSRTYQNVGPVGVRLVRVDSKRRTCDLNFQFKGRRYVQRRFQVNRAVRVKPARSTNPVEVTVSAISHDAVVVALTELPGNLAVTSSPSSSR